MATRIYLPVRINADIGIIRHMSDIARYIRAHISDRHPIRIRMAIRSHNVILGLTNLASSGFGGRGGRQEVP